MSLTFTTVNLDLSAAVFASLIDELARGGMADGFCILGSETAEADDARFVWHCSNDLSVFMRYPRSLLITADEGRVAARRFLAMWRFRHERRMDVMNRVMNAFDQAPDAVPAGFSFAECR